MSREKRPTLDNTENYDGEEERSTLPSTQFGRLTTVTRTEAEARERRAGVSPMSHGRAEDETEHASWTDLTLSRSAHVSPVTILNNHHLEKYQNNEQLVTNSEKKLSNYYPCL